jgi:hypothetical protein
MLPATGAGDKVQVVSIVAAVLSRRHDKPHDISSIVPALATNARTDWIRVKARFGTHIVLV